MDGKPRAKMSESKTGKRRRKRQERRAKKERKKDVGRKGRGTRGKKERSGKRREEGKWRRGRRGQRKRKREDPEDCREDHWQGRDLETTVQGQSRRDEKPPPSTQVDQVSAHIRVHEVKTDHRGTLTIAAFYTSGT